MKFTDLPYSRPDVQATSTLLRELITKLENANSTDELLALMIEIRTVRSEFETLRSIASVRHSIDTTDPFYDGENKYFDEQSPDYVL